MRYLHIVFVLLLAVFFQSCKKETPTYEYTFVGHGGSGFDIYDAPEENTPKAVDYCVAFGGEGVELDIQMSADGVLYTFHDEFLKDDSKICEQNAENIDNKDFKVYRLEETIENLPPEIKLYLDPKLYGGCVNYFDTANFVSAIQKLQTNHQNELTFLLSSSSFFGLVQSHLWKAFYTGYNYEDSKEKALSNNLEGVMISQEEFTAEMVNDAHQNGLRTGTYNVRSSQSVKSAMDKRIEVIVLDPVHLIPNY